MIIFLIILFFVLFMSMPAISYWNKIQEDEEKKGEILDDI